jgi:hypothetical protein
MRPSIPALVACVLVSVACGDRQLMPAPDASTTNCANVGCASPPLCAAGCQAACGCCACTPGAHDGDLVCTDRGCYEPAPVADGGVDGGEAVCGLPFDVGPCDAAIPVYAFVGGDCVPRSYGGCQGNGNRFSTLQDCIATCAAKAVSACLPNRAPREICLACGPAGGCAATATVCALICPDSSACKSDVPFCADGVCQYAAFCI